jgi:hypothetical protein
MKIYEATSILALLLAGCVSSDTGIPAPPTSAPREDGKGPKDPAGGKGVPSAVPSPSDKEEAEIVFRSEGGTETVYLVFRQSGTYSIMIRAHLLTIESEKGAWKQENDGHIVITHDSVEDHIVPFSYGAYTALSSPDHDLVSIFTPTPQEAKELIDGRKDDSPPMNVFLKADPERSSKEWATGHPFLFFPEWNKDARPQPVLLK